MLTNAEHFYWFINPGDEGEGEGLRFSFPSYSYSDSLQRRRALRDLSETLATSGVSWIVPGRRDWTIDLDEFKRAIPGLPMLPKNEYERDVAVTVLDSMEWLKGKVSVEPEVENVRRKTGRVSLPAKDRYVTNVRFYVMPDDTRTALVQLNTPVEIQESIEHFREDNPEPGRAAFVMMRFGTTRAHQEISATIKNALAQHGIIGLRADDRQYHEDLYYNILTYMHGCGMGVAAFERIEQQSHNPNVALEVGYMLALRKQVCLLKDKTLDTLQGDLVGKLYRTFDTHDVAGTLPPELAQWISDRRLA